MCYAAHGSVCGLKLNLGLTLRILQITTLHIWPSVSSQPAVNGWAFFLLVTPTQSRYEGPALLLLLLLLPPSKKPPNMLCHTDSMRPRDYTPAFLWLIHSNWGLTGTMTSYNLLMELLHSLNACQLRNDGKLQSWIYIYFPFCCRLPS